MYSKSLTIPRSSRSYRVPELVQLACLYHSHIMIQNNQGQFNAKSIMGMMSLDPFDGTLVVSAQGDDEQQAVESVANFLKTGKAIG